MQKHIARIQKFIVSMIYYFHPSAENTFYSLEKKGSDVLGLALDNLYTKTIALNSSMTSHSTNIGTLFFYWHLNLLWPFGALEILPSRIILPEMYVVGHLLM